MLIYFKPEPNGQRRKAALRLWQGKISSKDLHRRPMRVLDFILANRALQACVDGGRDVSFWNHVASITMLLVAFCHDFR
ncbi:MAG: hypothetical protein R2911_41255 [Caldilineaceae bacterium]